MVGSRCVVSAVPYAAPVASMSALSLAGRRPITCSGASVQRSRHIDCSASLTTRVRSFSFIRSIDSSHPVHAMRRKKIVLAQRRIV